MLIERFEDEDGNPATIQSIDLAIDADSYFYFGNISVTAQNLKAATQDATSLVFENGPESGDSFFHEMICADFSASFGRYIFNDESSPSALEIALCKYICAPERKVEPGDKINFYFHDSKFEGYAIFPIVSKILKCRNKTSFHFHSNSKLSKPESIFAERSIKFFLQSIEYHGTKYGFLELYRSLESAFLQSILLVLCDEYDRKPKSALEKALNAVDKERAQLASLIIENGLEGLLNLLARDFDLIKKGKENPNLFAGEISKLFHNDGSGASKGVPDTAWRAAWIIYQIRCSIAHAGSQGIVFEDYADAENLIEGIYSYIERIVLSLIGIDFDT